MCHPCPERAQAPRAWLPSTGGFPAPRSAQSTSVPCTSDHPDPSPKAHFPAFFPGLIFPGNAVWERQQCSLLFGVTEAAWAQTEHNWGLSGCKGLAGDSEGMIRGLALPASTLRGEGARCILSPQQTDLSGPVGGLCTAIKLHWNCKASLYKSRSKPSIFYDGGHSLI